MSNATEGVVAPDILTPPLSPYRPSDTLSPENEHPDSKYNNWTMRSFVSTVKTITPWNIGCTSHGWFLSTYGWGLIPFFRYYFNNLLLLQDCKTPLEDIPPWMRIYAESSIETHTFFKFERYEYQELNAWQSMLLKLYRKDLNNVIKYYEVSKTRLSFGQTWQKSSCFWGLLKTCYCFDRN